MSEFTGDEKYLVAMGYLQCVFEDLVRRYGVSSPQAFSVISMKLESKLTNHTITETTEILNKLSNFPCNDIVNEILEEEEANMRHKSGDGQ